MPAASKRRDVFSWWSTYLRGKLRHGCRVYAHGNVHNHASAGLAGLEHQIESQLSRQLDEPVVSRLGDDEHR